MMFLNHRWSSALVWLGLLLALLPHAQAQTEHTVAAPFKQELRRRAIAGDVSMQAVGIEDEVNGLIDPRSDVLNVPPDLLKSREATE